MHKKGSTELPYLSTAPLAGEGEEADLYVGQCNASSSSASSAGDAVEGRASMRGVEERNGGGHEECLFKVLFAFLYLIWCPGYKCLHW